MKRRSTRAALAKTAIIIGAIVCGLLLVNLISQIHDDRSYRLVITGAATVYENSVPSESNHPNPVVTVLGPRDQVEVRRIRFTSDGGWVRVRLPDHREGYIFMDSPIELKRR